MIARTTTYQRWGKSIIERTLAAAGLFMLSPLIGALAALVRIQLGSPVFYVQERPGLHGISFHIYKFRTMKDSRGPDGSLLPDAKRISPFGHFLRSTSLDELPELWNVLRGDMSLVGPRPLLLEYLNLYTPEQLRRHDVKPGITGWAQVNGRNAISWERRFELDTWYVDNRSFLLDLKILWMTIVKVLKRDGINAEDQATMQRFTGSSE
ncbi:MAG: sugar transferase [Rhodothermales bacterium]